MAHTSWFGIELSYLYGTLLDGIVRQTRCSHRARDILHDALVRYATAASASHIETPHLYLRRIVGSALADHYRLERRYIALPEEDGDTALIRQGETRVPSPEEIADMRQRLAQLQAVLQALPPKCREVFWLLRIEGMSHEEIATRLGISRKTVEGHVARALVRLVALRRHIGTDLG